MIVEVLFSPVGKRADLFQHSFSTIPYILSTTGFYWPCHKCFGVSFDVCFDDNTQLAVHLGISDVEDHEFFQGCCFKVKSSPPLDFTDQLDLTPKFVKLCMNIYLNTYIGVSHCLYPGEFSSPSRMFSSMAPS